MNIGRFSPGDLVAGRRSAIDAATERHNYVYGRLVREPYLKLDDVVCRFSSQAICLVLGVVPVDDNDLLLLLVQNGTACGACGYAWADQYCDLREATALPRNSRRASTTCALGT